MMLCNKFVILLLFLVTYQTLAKTPKIVTILSDNGYPPYSYVENGKPKGIYIDLINEAAKRVANDYQIIIRPLPWKRALKEIENGNALAIIPPYIHSQKRPYMWPYSSVLSYERIVVFCHNHIDFKAHLLRKYQKGVKPINIGINAGYLILNEQLSKAKRNKKIKMWENRSTTSNILKLIEKRIDCYINDPLSSLWVLKSLQKEKPQLNFDNITQSLEVMVQTAHIGYTNSKGHKFDYKDDFVIKFDKALLAVKRDKVLEKIIAKYTGE